MADKTGYRSLRKYCKVDMTEAQNRIPPAIVRSMISLFVRCVMTCVRSIPILTSTARRACPERRDKPDWVVSKIKFCGPKAIITTYEALLAGNYLMADKFRNGTFVTTYLSPRDYHRVHV